MKGHFLSLFSVPNRKWTISLLIASFLLIAVSLGTGMKNNITMHIMFVAGTGFLYLAMIHGYKTRKAENAIR